MSIFGHDLRYAIRNILRYKGFSAAAVLTLGLGIGANTAIFSVVQGVLIQPLPYQQDSQLFLLQQTATGAVPPNFSVQELNDLRQSTHSFDQIVEYHSLNFSLLGRGEPERVRSGVVSWNFFQTLGIRPILGRSFVPEDDVDSAEPVLVLSYSYWMRSFGGDSSVIGEHVEMNDHVHTIIGVLPAIPEYPRQNDVYMPTVGCPFRSGPGWKENRNVRALTVFTRVKESTTPQQLADDLARTADEWQSDHAQFYTNYTGHRIQTTALKEQLVRNARPTVLILMGTVALVLLIACANVANLLLARLLRRQREIAVRTALGADRWRLLRQLITESLVLTTMGGILGLGIAILGLDVLVGFTEQFTTRAQEISIDGAVLGFAVLVSVITGIVFGLLPALPSRQDLGVALRETSTQSTAGTGKLRLRSALVVSQLAVSFMLLVGAALVVRSLINLQRVDAGVHTDNVLTLTVAIPFNAQIDGQKFRETVLREIRSSSGVRSAALASSFPLGQTNPFNNQFEIVGAATDTTDRPSADIRIVSDGYFETIGQSLLVGRTFEERDRQDAPTVAIINQALARRHFGDRNPIGQRLKATFNGTEYEIVGVVADVRQALDAEVQDEIYLSTAQFGFVPQQLLIATASEPLRIAEDVKAIVHREAPDVPVTDILTLAEVRRGALASPRVTALLIGSFAVLALVITATGIAGVIGFSIAQRTPEIGLRMALGADTRRVLIMILRQGMALVGVGLLIGVVGSLALGRLVSKLLFAITPTDPLTYVGVGLLLFGVAATATLHPARRATKIDPLVALRSE
jgi:putative ABC transport system permease protein